MQPTINTKKGLKNCQTFVKILVCIFTFLYYLYFIFYYIYIYIYIYIYNHILYLQNLAILYVKTINLNDVIERNIKEQNPIWSQTPDHCAKY